MVCLLQCERVGQFRDDIQQGRQGRHGQHIQCWVVLVLAWGFRLGGLDGEVQSTPF